MKLWTWLQWLGYNLLALWTMSSIMSKDNADGLFHCLYNQLCNKRIFEHIRSCWFILEEETKHVVQRCTLSTCRLRIPDEFLMEDLCNDKISYSKKKECFFSCVQKFLAYVAKLEQEALFGSTYERIWHTKNCMSPLFEKCIT